MEQMYDTKLLSQIWSNAASFVADYNSYEAAINNINKIDEAYVAFTWQLVCSKYANTPIRSNSESQFRLSFFGIMASEAPTWVRRLEIQKSLRELTDDQLSAGDIQISNSASNPDEEPTTNTLDELTYVNHQNTQRQKRSKLTGLALLDGLLQNDLCESYVRKFSVLFKRVYVPAEYIYVSEEDDES